MKIFSVVIVVVESSNMILHGIGLYLLLLSDHGINKTVQHMLITNLAASELLKNTANLFEDSLLFLKRWINGAAVVNFSRVFVAMMYSLYAWAMLYLTGDRLLTAIMGEKYTIFISRRKVRSILVATWLFHVVSALTVFTLMFIDVSYGDDILEYLYLGDCIITLVNLILVILAYATIFRLLWRISSTAENTLSFAEIFRTSGYFITVLLITSFILLMVVPTVLWTIYPADLDQPLSLRTFVIILLLYLSDTVDVYIYVFKYTCVRRLLMRKLMAAFPCFRAMQVGVNVEPYIPGAHQGVELINIESGAKEPQDLNVHIPRGNEDVQLNDRDDKAIKQSSTEHFKDLVPTSSSSQPIEISSSSFSAPSFSNRSRHFPAWGGTNRGSSINSASGLGELSSLKDVVFTLSAISGTPMKKIGQACCD